MSDPKPRRLLLVEDQVNLGSTLAERLAGVGYKVVWARNLRQAEVEIASGPFDLALVDVGLPDGSGFTLGASVRSRHPGIGVIFLTALGDPIHRVRGLELGAEDYVVKPFHFHELVLRIENAMRRRRHWEQVPGQLTVGRASVDFLSLTAEAGGKSTTLGAREAALLRFLIARRGTVVSRHEILDAVWSRDEYPTPRTVDNFIVRLRRLIEDDPERPAVLRTVRGAGYQLTLPSP